MDVAGLRTVCLDLPGATESVQWRGTRVFKVGGKMFACSGIEADGRYSMKAGQSRFLELTDQPGIAPAPYLARAHWVQIDPTVCRLPPTEIKGLVLQSYDLVFSRLPKKKQREIRGAP